MATVAPPKTKRHTTRKVPPTYPSHSLLGILPEFNRDPLGLFLRVARDHSDVVRLRAGPVSVYFINHPDYIQHVLQQNNRNYRRLPRHNNLVKLVFGLNLFSSDGDHWLGQRRLMQPAFHRRHIAGFGQIMTDAALNLLARWEPAAKNGRLLNMHQEMMRLTMEVVGKTLFSVDLSADTNLLGQGFNAKTAYINYRINNKVLYAPLFIPTRRNRNLKRAIKDGNRLLQDMIDERRRTRVQKDDLLGMLLEARDEETDAGMSNEQLQNELDGLIFAGHETTSNVLSWTFYLLSQNPDAEQELLAELDTVLAGRVPTIDDLPHLKYTRRVLDESMRLYPPIWALVGREAIQDDEIGDYHIAAKSGVLISPYVLHRNPRFWDDPERFDPDRFSSERSQGRHKFAYIPFGGGARKCIGETMALTEAQLILATILPHYRLRLKRGYKVEPIVTLRVKGGLPMTIVPR